MAFESVLVHRPHDAETQRFTEQDGDDNRDVEWFEIEGDTPNPAWDNSCLLCTANPARKS